MPIKKALPTAKGGTKASSSVVSHHTAGRWRGRLASTVQWQCTVHRQPSLNASPSVSTVMRTNEEKTSCCVKTVLRVLHPR